MRKKNATAPEGGPTTSETIELLLNRVSVRKYDDRAVGEDTLKAVLEAAFRSPTSSNIQAYSVVVVRDAETKAKLSEVAGGQQHVKDAPVFLAFCADIREVAAENALFLNYANPMAMNTWAVNKYTNVRHLGLCHGVEHGFAQICSVLGIKPTETDFICAGINHQTWYINVTHKGKDMPKCFRNVEVVVHRIFEVRFDIGEHQFDFVVLLFALSSLQFLDEVIQPFNGISCSI